MDWGKALISKRGGENTPGERLTEDGNAGEDNVWYNPNAEDFREGGKKRRLIIRTGIRSHCYRMSSFEVSLWV